MNLHQDNDGFLERCKKENEKLEGKIKFKVVTQEELDKRRCKAYKTKI